MKPFFQGPLYFEAISCNESLDKGILQDVAMNENCDLTLKDEVEDLTKIIIDYFLFFLFLFLFGINFILKKGTSNLSYRYRQHQTWLKRC